MSYFVYRPLTPYKRSIRLLNVLPEKRHQLLEDSFIGDHEDSNSNIPVSCTVSHVSLDDAPAYTALSYNWGNTTRQCAILINGATLTVTENLDAALRHLRLQDEPRTLWVDALCINQSDDVEKSEQIQQMRQIYSQALSVVAWLGPAADNSDFAMQWIQQYGGRSFELGIGMKPEMQLRRLLESLESPGEDFMDETLKGFIEDLKVELSPINPQCTHVITSLSSLLNRAYWSRIWVVQELTSAPNVSFVCGKQMILEDALHHALRLLRNYRLYQLLKWGQNAPAIHPREVSLVSINPRNPILLLKIRRAPQLYPLIYLMRSLRHFQATDPRDKLFALLGIAADTKALGLRPDYRKSCEEVYTHLARTLIWNGYIELLSFCEFPKQVSGIPSWVPDWSHKIYRSSLQERSLDRSVQPVKTFLEPKFSASGMDCIRELKKNDTIGWNMPLVLSAVSLGEVRRVGKIWERDAIGTWLHDLYSLSYLITDASKLSSGREQAVWRTAVADQEIRIGMKKPRLSEEKIRVVHEALKNKNLAMVDAQVLISAGLGEYCQQLQAIAQSRRPILTSGGFLGISSRKTEPGDVILNLLGASVPHVLRYMSITKKTSKLQLVGEAYIHGMMDGEAMEGNPIIETIEIW